MKTLFVLAAIATAIAMPGPASAQAGLDDPDLLAWMHAANAAQQERFEALALREDPRSLLMAMQLVHPIFPLREDPERELAGEKARAWALLERAAQAGPDDPLVAWKLATCPADSGLAVCGSPASRERLQAVAGSHAAAQLWLAQAAQAVGDEAAVESHMQAAAEAEVFSFEHDIGELVWSALESIDVPEAGPEIAKAYARQMEIDEDAFEVQIIALSVLPRIAASTMPTYSFPLSPCGVAADSQAVSALRRQQCVAIFRMMADDRASLLQRMIAEGAMVRLAADGPGAEEWKARLRTTLWVHDAAAPLTLQMSTRHDQAYFEAWRREGEYQALVQLMARSGVGMEPPDGWLPENEDMRTLLGDDATAPRESDSAQEGSAADPQPE